MAFVVVSWTLIAISEKPTLLVRQALILHCHTTQYMVKVLQGTSYGSAASAIFAIYIYHLFVAMLHITVVQYEKGERQTQKSAGGKTD